ncbi:MAG: hypothetical protein RLZZ146_343 [Bacteroidota bacterium]|jgi:uncharacterized protein YdaU (DUF1376 family)
MHYYQFNIGDYKSHTEHLSEMEDLTYRRMLDWYYLHEKPLPTDYGEIARLIRMRSHIDCIAVVLHEFFDLVDGGWIHHRANAEIAKAGEKSNKASESAKARWNKVKDANALPAQSESNATQDPLPITQDTEHIISLSGSTFPTCPQKELLSLWKKHLPHLTQPRSWEGSRQANMKQRWIQAGKPSDYSPEGYKTVQDGLKWWDSFFAYIANDTSLARGFEGNGRTWRPDLEWVVNATNFQKIIDGKYNK